MEPKRNGKRERRLTTPPPAPHLSRTPAVHPFKDTAALTASSIGSSSITAIEGANTPPPPALKRQRRGPARKIFLADDDALDGDPSDSRALLGATPPQHPTAVTTAISDGAAICPRPRAVSSVAAVSSKSLISPSNTNSFSCRIEGDGVGLNDDEVSSLHSADVELDVEKRENKLLEQADGLSGAALRDFLSNQFMDGLDEVDNVLAMWK